MPSFPNLSPLSRLLQLALPVLLWTSLTPVLANDPHSMMEQLDRLDRVELLDFLDKAEVCVAANNFDCADSNLAKAKKFAKSGKNLGDWNRVNGLVTTAKIRIEQQRLARIRAEEEAERERRRLAREEAEEAAREERARERREAARLAELEADNDASQPSTASLILGTLNSTLQNYNRYNAQITAQTQTILRQASEARAREAEAERARQRAAAQRQADERNRLNDMRAANERRQQEATSRAERARAEANAEQQRAQAEQEERKRALLAEQAARNERERRAAEMRQRQEREKAERLAQQ